MAYADLDELTAFIAKSGRGRFADPEATAKAVQTAARGSYRLPRTCLLYTSLHEAYRWQRPLRSLGVKAAGLATGHRDVQLDLFTDGRLREKWERIDKTVDGLRGRFGNRCIQRAAVLQDSGIAAIDAKKDHIIHPVGFF